MKAIVSFVMVVMAGAVSVQAEEPSLLKSAERLATETVMQDGPMRMRSMGRTWTGVALLGVGTALALNELASTCATNNVASAVFDVPTCGNRGVRLGAWGALATTGALLATIWSDVPVAREIQVNATPDRFTVGRRFSF